MKNIFKFKAFLRIVGIVSMALVIGFSMAACGEFDDGGDEINSILNGTWVNEYGDEMILNNGNFEYPEDLKGTYTISDTNITITPTHCYDHDEYGIPGWFIEYQMKEIIIQSYENSGEEITGAEIDEYLNELFAQRTGTYSLDENTLTIIIDGTTYTLSGSDDGYGSEINPIPLKQDAWFKNRITSTASGSAVWYSFNVTRGTTYYVWWNDGLYGGGDGSKTLNVTVSAYLNNLSTPISNFDGVDSAWNTAKFFTASSSGTVKLKVAPYTSGKIGTFAIAYKTTNTRP